MEKIFEVPVHCEKATFDFDKAFDGSRGQYGSGVLLQQILSRGAGDGATCIAVVDVDLFIPVLTFIFGEAQFGGRASIVSIHRLSNQYYGMPEDGVRLLERLEKEIIHELGHTFGLYHCHQFECVMRSSTYVEEIDLKQAMPCHSCAEQLHSHRHHHPINRSGINPS